MKNATLRAGIINRRSELEDIASSASVIRLIVTASIIKDRYHDCIMKTEAMEEWNIRQGNDTDAFALSFHIIRGRKMVKRKMVKP